MREHVQHGERCGRSLPGQGRADREVDNGAEDGARPSPRRVAGEAGTRERPEPSRVGPRSPRGPRPMRPIAVPTGVRPPGLSRPAPVTVWRRESFAPRVLVREPVVDMRRGGRYRLRRVVAGLAVMAASATAVIALGLLAQIAGQSVESAADAPRAPASSILVTAQPGETVWEVAARVAPDRSGPEVAALAERIAGENALSSARLGSGQVLRVPAG
jgi:hypothetical protein